ncbi:ATPase, AAA family [hydrothermal vent metagenome]|uniref:ATPase, AAA family n=1 Tax=hydrothermal vent metagenome TaxID=652676 RepID=A0A1W1C552_9ZZZZ
MWVGGTEKNIANAFREAKEEKAVLVFDEVDSFLADRTGAKQSWEVTQVNEMLVQMENFDGIFIATTNLMDNLDRASLRRFDLKLEFSYLKP